MGDSTFHEALELCWGGLLIANQLLVSDVGFDLIEAPWAWNGVDLAEGERESEGSR